ncbi:MAG: flagellar assembly protein FliX [Pseudomonadota bacterium]
MIDHISGIKGTSKPQVPQTPSKVNAEVNNAFSQLIAATNNAKTAGLTASSGVTLPILAMVNDPKQLKHLGQKSLTALNKLQKMIAEGGITNEVLNEIGALVQEMANDSNDHQLNNIVAEIKTRLAVELAKHDVATT